MDQNTIIASAPLQQPLPAAPITVAALDVVEGSPKNHTTSAQTPTPGVRATRHRSSLPSQSTPVSRTLRGGPPKDLERIQKQLAPERVQEKKDELVRRKESALRDLVDGHDTAVLEKFHLERYISLLEGWDPVHLKQKQEPVYLDYKRANHNLLDLIPRQTAIPVAGPSRARASGPARTTRRQAHEISEIFSAPAPAPAPVPTFTPVTTPGSGKGKGKVKLEMEDVPVPEPAVRGKGKGRASLAAHEDPTTQTGRRKSSAHSPSVEMPPPPVPIKKGKGRRATMGVPDLESEPAEAESESTAGTGKGKKRGRMSMPNLPVKKLRGQLAEDAAAPPSPGPDPGTSTPAKEPSPSPAPPPEPLPSLAHLSFPYPPARPKERVYGPKTVWYTDPSQIPPAVTPYNGQLAPILESYLHVDDGINVDIKALELRAAREAYYRNRVNWLQHQGRLLRLLDEADAEIPGSKGKVPGLPARQTDHQDSLMAHMIQVRNAVMAESKSKPIVCKRIARMVTAYWEHEEGKEERERLAEEKELKRKAKELVRAIRRRWALAVKVVRARLKEIQKAEQDRLGKEHLQNMLQRSSGLLEAQRDDITGQGERADDDEDDEDDESDDDLDDDDDDNSEGTDAVSAAEDSDAETDEEEEERVEVDNGDITDADGEDDLDEDEMGVDGSDDDDSDDASDEESERSEGGDLGTRALLEQVDDAEDVLGDIDDAQKPGQDRHDPSLATAEPPAALEGSLDGPHATNEASSPKVAPLLSSTAASRSDEALASSTEGIPSGKDVPGTAYSTSAASRSINLSAPTTSIPVPSDPLIEAGQAASTVPIISTDALISAVQALPENPAGEDTPGVTRSSPESSPDPIDSLSPRKAVRAPSPARHLIAKNGTQSETLTTFASTVVQETNSIREMDVDEPLAPTPPTTSGHIEQASSPIYRPRSRRARKSRSVSLVSSADDPDANDVEFEAKEEELSDQDHAMDVEMEEDEGDSRNSEDEGLLADADLPIEELLKRYGYEMPSASTEEVASSAVEDGRPAVEPSVDQPMPEESTNGDTPHVNGVTDKSLMDEALEGQPQPGLIVEGKRNRRVRSVWTPEDNPPHPVKKPKIETVDSESEREMTPELSVDEESDGEEDEEIVDPEEANRVRPPFLLRGELRPYQQAGLEWLASLYANKMNGILADEMGLGKTIQTIALLGHLACDKGVWGQHLIIVPTSVILNWEMEFKKFLPGLKILTYYGNQKERKEKRKGWHSETGWQVCITSYQIVLADQHIFRRKSWVYMILDEAHNIKNFRSQRWQTLLGFKASRRLLLTGTPLQNNLMELWSLLYFLMPNGVAEDATAVVGFANHKEFSEWFSNPMDKAIETSDALDEETLETVAKLHTLLRPFILRRLKSEVETQLPGKFEHVVYCKLSKRQRFLYDEFMSRASTKEALMSGGYLGVVNTLMQLRKVCNHPDLFEVRPVRTSFAMERSVLSDFEPAELIVRKRLLAQHDQVSLEALNLLFDKEDQSGWACRSRRQLDASMLLPHAEEVQIKGRKPPVPKLDTRTVAGWTAYRAHKESMTSTARWRSLRDVNRLRCSSTPIYGSTFLNMVSGLPNKLLPGDLTARSKADMMDQFLPPVAPLIHSFADRAKQVGRLVDYYAVMPPNVVARDVSRYALPGLVPEAHPSLLEPEFDTLHQATVKLQIAFPDTSLLQYDCGKLQKLDEMLRDLKADGHRVLIFTQMTRVLDILEMFLSYNGHRYLRLDGSTKIEDRQIITERFNSDSRIFCFIASSRSGGVGINLTGADTVFFYDSDWNPSMDRQCMDRAHRIGQTREVHIYRFVSIHTVEENMLKKANQKRLLDRVVIQEGDFTTEFFGKMDWRDIIDTPGDETVGERAKVQEMDEEDERVEDVDVEGTPVAMEASRVEPRAGEERELAKALAEVEDEEDAAAARVAQGEGELDIAEFGETAKRPAPVARVSFAEKEASGTPVDVETPIEGLIGGERGEEEGEAEVDGEGEDEVGAVDEYMLKWVEEDWDYFVNY